MRNYGNIADSILSYQDPHHIQRTRLLSKGFGSPPEDNQNPNLERPDPPNSPLLLPRDFLVIL